MKPDLRPLWLAFGSTGSQPLEEHRRGWRVGPVVISHGALARWEAAGWVRRASLAPELHLTPEGRAAAASPWTP